MKFQIENDVLVKATVKDPYTYRKYKITIPDGVKEIGENSFNGCVEIETVELPEGVEKIGSNAFYNCHSMRSITFPNSLTSVAEDAFAYCNSLSSIKAPSGLDNVDVDTIESFIIPRWTYFQAKLIAKLFLNNYNESLAEKCAKVFGRDPFSNSKSYATKRNALGKAIADAIKKNPSEAQCIAAANFILFTKKVCEVSVLKQIYEMIAKASCSKAISLIEADPEAVKRLEYVETAPVITNDIEKKIYSLMPEKKIASLFKKQYSIEEINKVVLKDKSGKKLSLNVLKWLYLINDERTNNVPIYNKPGICPEAAEVVSELDAKSFQKAISSTFVYNVYGTGNRLYLSYPVCRYADDETLSQVLKRAEGFKSATSGKNAPVIKMVRQACIYSTLKQAIFFAEKYKDLDEYARLRGTDADTIRDTTLVDVGLDENGCKKYDLGNQTVVVHMQPDYSFVVELPDGQTAKSLPKRGADESLYEAANNDFSSMKKSVKKIVKNRFAVLFEDFLSGKAKDAKSWETVYFSNPMLKQAVKLIVWSQGDKTFTVSDAGLIDSNNNSYTLGNDAIKVAHPMEMDKEDIERWQKYFTSHSLKQPFIQIWEPVRSSSRINEDRYKGAMIPYYRFLGQEKHGITVTDSDFHSYIDISFKGLETDIDRIDYARHSINPEDRFEIKKISFSKYTRQVNHEIAYLDKVTVWGRIKDDDQSIADMLTEFTLAQITEFIKVAQEAKAVNVLALLMEYKNKTYSDYDPMDEFTLDW